MNGTKTFSIKLPGAMLKTLDSWADITGYSRNRVVTMLIERGIREGDPRALFIDELDRRQKKK